MPNETRPRREPSNSSRIRKASPLSSGGTASTSPASDTSGPAPLAHSQNPHEPGELTAPPVSDYRERGERESYRDERPADREPIRYRDREQTRESRDRGEPVPPPIRDTRERGETGIPIRERLSRER